MKARFGRRSGILMHVTSLPGRHGIGTLGPEAFEFVDFLAAAHQKLWQVLPVGPTGIDNSPYAASSAFAGNPLLISLDRLVEDGLLDRRDLRVARGMNSGRVDFDAVRAFKQPLLHRAFEHFRKSKAPDRDYRRFERAQRFWLDDYALYAVLKRRFDGKPWIEWPSDIMGRKRSAVAAHRRKLAREIEYEKFVQFTFFQQWRALKAYAQQHGVCMIGDLAIYVAFDSADAWTYEKAFQLDENRYPIKVAGVPPDAFSDTGQLWGNPVYDWSYLEKNHFDWWIHRLKMTLSLVDIIRLDHFRGFASYWAVPFGDKTAVGGRWVKAPGTAFFQAIKDEFGHLPIIAEDLGEITKDVIQLRNRFQLPGMKVLQFAFDQNPRNEFLPHNYQENFVVYSGTHDNDTTAGWYRSCNAAAKKQVRDYLRTSAADVSWSVIRAAWSSVAIFAIVPIQDVLGLGSEARMNIPGREDGNWGWRLDKKALTSDVTARLQHVTDLFGR